jgi:hypothetical protein
MGGSADDFIAADVSSPRIGSKAEQQLPSHVNRHLDKARSTFPHKARHVAEPDHQEYKADTNLVF